MTYWNYRVVRRKHVHTHEKKKYTTYTYGIHEVYYDDNDFASMVTKEPSEPFGGTVTDCQGSYELMAGAFTKPILDYDKIPEPGYTKEADAIQRGIEDCKAGRTIPHDEVMKKLHERNGTVYKPRKFNYAKAMKEDEAERIIEEEKYAEKLKKLIKKVNKVKRGNKK